MGEGKKPASQGTSLPDEEKAEVFTFTREELTEFLWAVTISVFIVNLCPDKKGTNSEETERIDHIIHAAVDQVADDMVKGETMETAIDNWWYPISSPNLTPEGISAWFQGWLSGRASRHATRTPNETPPEGDGEARRRGQKVAGNEGC